MYNVGSTTYNIIYCEFVSQQNILISIHDLFEYIIFMYTVQFSNDSKFTTYSHTAGGYEIFCDSAKLPFSSDIKNR